MLIREALDKTRVAVPVRLTATFPVPSDTLARTYRGVPVKNFIDLDPYRAVQRLAVGAAKQWIRHMALQGYDLLGNETDVELWGPYRPKPKLYRSLGEFDSAGGFASSEDPFESGEARMILRGQFLARKQYSVEGQRG